ncbi:Crp/Fnr family transcriptional regulator [Candidatus Daviesbacteria bacterium]|nr:Crp/Fnr family transcriptional regulator [Candidatus Daviesbacteria bacterium]
MDEPKAIEKLENFYSQFATKRFYKKKEMIIRADDDPPGVFYLKDGHARLYTVSPSGQELTFNVLKPGCYFSMMWAIGGAQNSHYFEALTEIELWRAPKDQLLEFIRRDPEVLYELTRRILIGLDGLLGVMESLLFGNAYNKVATALVVAAKRFGRKSETGQVTIELPLTHQVIASLACLTRETTSLVMKEFENGGLINNKRPFLVITNMERLEKETILSKEEESLPNIF